MKVGSISKSPSFISPDRMLRPEPRRRGLDVSRFAPDQMTSAGDFYWFPNLLGPMYPGTAIMFRVRPNGLDPDSAVMDLWTPQWPGEGWRPCEHMTYPDWSAKDWDSSRTRTSPTWSTSSQA
jgi:hypothetical protein